MIFDVYPIDLFTVAGFGLVGYGWNPLTAKTAFLTRFSALRWRRWAAFSPPSRPSPMSLRLKDCAEVDPD